MFSCEQNYFPSEKRAKARVSHGGSKQEDRIDGRGRFEKDVLVSLLVFLSETFTGSSGE